MEALIEYFIIFLIAVGIFYALYYDEANSEDEEENSNTWIKIVFSASCWPLMILVFLFYIPVTIVNLLKKGKGKREK